MFNGFGVVSFEGCVSSSCASRSPGISYMGFEMACGGIIFTGLTVYSAGGDGSVDLVRLSSPADKESLLSKLSFGGSVADLRA